MQELENLGHLKTKFIFGNLYLHGSMGDDYKRAEISEKKNLIWVKLKNNWGKVLKNFIFIFFLALFWEPSKKTG